MDFTGIKDFVKFFLPKTLWLETQKNTYHYKPPHLISEALKRKINDVITN